MKFSLRKIVLALGTLCLGIPALAQTDNGGNSSPTPDPGKIIQFLSSTVSWYRQLAVEQKAATEPADVTFVQENRRIADQVVPLAFEYARNQARLQARQSANPQQAPQQSGGSGQNQRLAQAAQKVEQDLKDTKAELDSFRAKLAETPEARKRLLQTQIAEAQSEVALLEARRDALQSMIEFANTSNTGTGAVGLRAQIEELARAVPAALRRSQAANQSESTREPSSSGDNFVGRRPQPSGIWRFTADLIRLSGKTHTLQDELSATEDLKKYSEQLRAPLLAHLRSLIRQGDQLFAAADTATPALLAQQKQQIDALTAQFKQTSAGLLPLSKIIVLLGIYETTLNNWRESVRDEEHDELRQLLLRLGVLLILSAAVFTIGEIWRRASLRYIHDAQRRHQFLLLRRAS